MANVQLPSINVTPGDIDKASLPELQKIVKGLINTVAILTEELSYLLNNLDTRNVNEIDGDILVTGTVTAAKMLVDELSAISADLGKITSGEVYGAYIATRENAYPRAELNSNQNLFGALASANNFIRIYTPTSGFSPTIMFSTPGGVAYITYNISDNAISVTSNDANINISTQQKIELFAQQGVYLTGWDMLKNNSTGNSLEDDFVMK